MHNKTRVLVVDDSALVRSLLAEIINRERDMECVGAAKDPISAREMIRDLNPDVITLDVEMPRMDGIDFLGRLMRLRPMPVLMISSLTEHGADITLRALEMGAVDFVAKPRIGVANGLQELASDIVEKIRVAAVAQVQRLPGTYKASPVAGAVLSRPAASMPAQTARVAQRPAHRLGVLGGMAGGAGAEPAGLTGKLAPLANRSASAAELAALPAGAALGPLSSEVLIAIGASTGGTEAIREVLGHLPADSPAIVITQHMPAGFTANFAARLNSLCRVRVKEAEHGERLLPGHAYIAPGGKQFYIKRLPSYYVAMVSDGPAVNRHKPSVQVLFESVALQAGRHALGIMLTGMGGDGASAMRQMRAAGSYNYVQDQASCVVFGMPREAIAQGAADEVLPLTQIAPALVERLRIYAQQYSQRHSNSIAK